MMIAFLNDSGLLKSIMDKEEAVSREQIGYLNQFIKRITEFETGSDDRSVCLDS